MTECFQPVSYKQTPEDENVDMFWPIDRDMIGTEWSHLTVVAEYPQPAWVQNRKSFMDGVPKPWTPVGVKKTSQGSDIPFGAGAIASEIRRFTRK
jgi:hypothetical protein